MIAIADARAMVAQLFWYAPAAKQDVIARLMVQDGVCAMHAAWLAYGRARGYPCTCTPCLSAPPVGSEVVVRILMRVGDTDLGGAMPISNLEATMDRRNSSIITRG